MNREGGETFLRLLAEAEMRDQLAPSPPPWTGSPGAGRVKVKVVGQALTAVRALDTDTVEDILADFDLAVSVRRLHDKAGQGPAGTGLHGTTPRTMRAASAARLAAQIQFGRAGPAARLALSRPPGSTGSPGPADPEDPPPADHDPDQGTPDRFVPLGVTVPLHHDGISGDLHLMSYAHTGSGARFIALWGKPTLSPQHEMGLQNPELFPIGRLTVTDDRGSAYELDYTHGGGSEWISEISLHPAPPDDIRWLEVAAPPSPAVRVDLTPPGGGEPEVSEAALSPGEQLLIMLAEQLLTVAAQFPLAPRPGLPEISPRPVQAMGAGLGDIIAGLEAVDVLSPLSPVPARLAALCASLRIGGHGIAAAPADDLPEPWLSLLAYYQRRKPDTAQVRDGYAAVTAALPELDGIRLALVGLHNTQGATVLHVLARGVTREGRLGPFSVDLDFPLSFWLRDNGGRWHAAHPVGWNPREPEHAIGLLLVPPLPRSTTWVDVLAGGRSAEVRTRLPLRWGFPS
ncbi:MAG TPA: hypothetical protein VK280_05780 [Streptosporangiaceae bacterium]|nr:hypothetical protein [Streptosporangiaceae bacterium]